MGGGKPNNPGPSPKSKGPTLPINLGIGDDISGAAGSLWDSYIDFYDWSTDEQSKWIGAGTAGTVMLTGGECQIVDKMWVCFEGWLPMHARDGTTLGGTFVTSENWWNSQSTTKQDELIKHEKYHRDAQWEVYGALFPGMYFWEEITSGGGSCNKYEQDAQKYGGDGNYGTC